MSDEPAVDGDAEGRVGQDEQERVRRLLAAARHDEPAPADVVARLDAALAAEAARRPGPARPAEAAEAGEAADNPGAHPTPGVVDLAARRRRRRRTGLMAAAAVVVVGVGLGAVGLGDGLPVGGGGGNSQDSSAGGSVAEQEAPGALRQDDEAESAPDVMGAPVPLPTVRTGPTLAADVTRALRTGDVLAADLVRCAPAGDTEDADADVVAVRTEGNRAELVAQPASGGSREVALWSCTDDADTPLATLTVPAG